MKHEMLGGVDGLDLVMRRFWAANEGNRRFRMTVISSPAVDGTRMTVLLSHSRCASLAVRSNFIRELYNFLTQLLLGLFSFLGFCLSFRI